MYLFLINPEAGNKRFLKVESKMRQLLEKLNINYKFVSIPDLSQVDDLLNTHLSPKLTGIAAVGGNATVNAVINAMVGEELPLAIVPMSKTNFLANSLGIRRWDQAIRMLADPEIHSERLGKIGHQYFVDRIEVLSHANLLHRHVKKTSLLTQFLGIGADKKEDQHQLSTMVTVDEETKITGAINRIEAHLNPEKEFGRIHLTLATGNPQKPEITKLWASSFYVESDRKMAVVMGNETVAQTPVEIKALTKYIKLLVPKAAKRLTKSE